MSIDPNQMAQMLNQGPVVKFPVQQGRGAAQPQQEIPMEAHATMLGMELIVESDNLAEHLDEEELKEIGKRCVDEYKLDDESRDEWKRQNEHAIKLAKLVHEEKTWPWPGAASIKYPLLAEAAIAFAARAYPEIIRGSDVVLAKVIGPDPDNSKAEQAKRVSDFMSYQCTEEMEFWESDTDKLLHMLPVIGTCFRKTYHDPIRAGAMQSGNVSRLISGMDLIVNHNLANYDQVRRETEVIDLYENDVIERQRSGLWLDVDLKPDSIEGKEQLPQDDKPYRFIEQHRWLDLDGDGYEEPYIATVHEASSTVMRIVARFDTDDIVTNKKGEVVRITANSYYTKYGFIPNPDGGIYDLGFGILLTPINEAINSNINQLLDAGTLSNISGGFLARGIRAKTGQIRMMAGEWRVLDTGGALLRDSVMPNPSKEPSVVLFQLMSFLVEAGKSLASIKDVLQGTLPNADVPATTVLALIEQGQKVYNAIHKRVYRSLKQEFKKLFKLNGRYPPQQYDRIEENQQPLAASDFDPHAYDVCPVADPQISSQAQRLAKAQALLQVMGSFPGINQQNVMIDYVTAIGVDDPSRYLPTQQETDQQAQMQQQKQQQVEQLATQKAIADIKNVESMAALNMAKAGEQGQNPDENNLAMKALELQAQEQALNMKAENLKLQEQVMQAKSDSMKSQHEANDSTLHASLQSLINDAVTKVTDAHAKISADMAAKSQASTDPNAKDNPAPDAHAQMEQMSRSFHEAIKTLTAPKEIVRDPQGRAVGIRHVQAAPEPTPS